MKVLGYKVRESLRCYVNCIMVEESTDGSESFTLPLNADGYPGVMFQQSTNGFYLMPKEKKLSELFLYGQTIEPISLATQGNFSFIVFQLYPFASKHLLNVDPKELNDECYDLLEVGTMDTASFHQKLMSTSDLMEQVEILSDLMEALLSARHNHEDTRIHHAIHQIIRNKGIGKISQIRESVFMTERTFERNFLNEVGFTPKQFARIIQFQSTIERLSGNQVDTFTDLAYQSGFADQSHFNRVFKSYTGLSPKQYHKQVMRV